MLSVVWQWLKRRFKKRVPAGEIVDWGPNSWAQLKVGLGDGIVIETGDEPTTHADSGPEFEWEGTTDNDYHATVPGAEVEYINPDLMESGTINRQYGLNVDRLVQWSGEAWNALRRAREQGEDGEGK